MARPRVGRWYAHIALVAAAEFAAEAARGLVLPSLFSYAQLLDQPTPTRTDANPHAGPIARGDGNQLVFLGLLTALFSAGRFLSSLLLGCLSDRLAFSTLYHASAVVAILGNLLYVLPYSPRLRSKPLLAASRFLVGFGAGNRSVCRANIAALTPLDQRLSYFTLLATVVFLAYALTPGLGGVFGDIDVALGGSTYWHFNRFTAPGYLLVALNALVMLLNMAVYDASVTRDDAPQSPSTVASTMASSTSGSLASDSASCGHDVECGEGAKMVPSVPVDGGGSASARDASERMVALGVLVFIVQNFNARGILSVFETINVPLYEKVLNHTVASPVYVFQGDAPLSPSTSPPHQTVMTLNSVTEDAASFYFYMGAFGLLSYMSVYRLGLRHGSVSDVSLLVFGFACLACGNLLLVLLSKQLDTESRDHQVHLYMFVTGEILVWSVGCPITAAVVVPAFSRVLGDRPQGTLMGIFGASASIARMVLPLLPGLLPSWTALFTVMASISVASIAFLFAYTRAARPHRAPPP